MLCSRFQYLQFLVYLFDNNRVQCLGTFYHTKHINVTKEKVLAVLKLIRVSNYLGPDQVSGELRVEIAGGPEEFMYPP